jgi:zinc protease
MTSPRSNDLTPPRSNGPGVPSPRSVRPDLPPPREATLPPVQQYALANGLDVFIVQRRELPVVDMRVTVRAGAALDDPALAGCAQLTAQLLDEGTHSRTAMQVADEAERLGASLHTNAAWDSAEASLHVLSPRLEPAMELAADVMLRPALHDDEFARRQQQRLSAIMQERADPRVLASQAFTAAVYGEDHPFGTPIGGTRESVERLSPDHVRAFYDAHYSPRNAFIVVVGDVDPDTLLPRLDHHFGAWECGAAATTRGTGTAPARERSITILHRPGATQSEIRVGLDGPPRRTPDYFPLLVGNTVLGGSFMSRLNILLRQEKAYTYGAGSNFAFRAGGGPFLASTAVHTAATADAVNDMVEQVGRLAGEDVAADELERAKSYITLGLPRTFETTSDVAEHAGEVALYGLGADYMSRYASRVRAVTSSQVREAAERWLRPGELSIVIVGDADGIRGDLEGLAMGAVHVREGD